MTKQMLIDTTKPEVIRVAIINKDKRLGELEFETVPRSHLKGNIYLAKVTCVAPFLEGVFVDYGQDRHGFLKFSDIHPAYSHCSVHQVPQVNQGVNNSITSQDSIMLQPSKRPDLPSDMSLESSSRPDLSSDMNLESSSTTNPSQSCSNVRMTLNHCAAVTVSIKEDEESHHGAEQSAEQNNEHTATIVDLLSPDEGSNAGVSRLIRDVIKPDQIMVIQVLKESRGDKGAKLTTYLSILGRYYELCIPKLNHNKKNLKKCDVLDHSKIEESTTILDRMLDHMKEMRLRSEIKLRPHKKPNKIEESHDSQYLMALKEQIRTSSIPSTIPSLLYEEIDVIGRAIRDLAINTITTILIEGQEGCRKAKAYMEAMGCMHFWMSSYDQTKRVQPYKNNISLFNFYDIESQIEELYSSTVTLKSGGSIIIEQTEALVAIDVNSGRATQEQDIEQTAMQTNLEAAKEIARQLRLRDLAGLIVVDFITMEDEENRTAVERTIRNACRSDRALHGDKSISRISPSPFGLLQLSRERSRSSLLTYNCHPCPQCSGRGVIRTVESIVSNILCTIEKEIDKKSKSNQINNVTLTLPTKVALYILMHKRQDLAKIEEQSNLSVSLTIDDDLSVSEPPFYRLHYVIKQPTQERRSATNNLTIKPHAVGFDECQNGTIIQSIERHRPQQKSKHQAELSSIDTGNDTDDQSSIPTLKHSKFADRKHHTKHRNKTHEHSSKKTTTISDRIITQSNNDRSNLLAAQEVRIPKSHDRPKDKRHRHFSLNLLFPNKPNKRTYLTASETVPVSLTSQCSLEQIFEAISQRHSYPINNTLSHQGIYHVGLLRKGKDIINFAHGLLTVSRSPQTRQKRIKESPTINNAPAKIGQTSDNESLIGISDITESSTTSPTTSPTTKESIIEQSTTSLFDTNTQPNNSMSNIVLSASNEPQNQTIDQSSYSDVGDPSEIINQSLSDKPRDGWWNDNLAKR